MLTREVAWHDERRARIRRDYPDVRELYGPDRRTQLAVLGCVGAHFAVARMLKGAALGPWLGATLTVGPTLAHALGVLVHEATHNLVAKTSAANKAWALVCNLPLGAPAAVEFRAQHLLHHRHLGDVFDKDTQAPTLSEDEWVGDSTLRKLVSFTMGRVMWEQRPANRVPFDRWMAANWVTSFGATALVLGGWGLGPATYLLVSSLLAFGPHPYGARRLSEHLPVRDEQPTNSYYGVLNRVSFNVGYHVEHHDFPNVAWTRVRELRRLAAEHYDDLFAFDSWSSLIRQYFADRRFRVKHYVGLGPPLGEDVVESGSSAPKSAPAPVGTTYRSAPSRAA